MSLSTGRGPLSGRPAGRFTAAMPADVAYIEPFRRRVRGVKGGHALVDSERVLLVHRPGQPPVYAFPDDDVHGVAADPEPDTPGYVTVAWGVVDSWFEEAEEVHGHPRNPYHRIDCVRSERTLRVDVGPTTLVDTNDTLIVYETSLEPKLYVEPRHVRMDTLVKSATVTYCPYKGTASYWSYRTGDDAVADVAWTYEDPLPESAPLRGYLSFDGSRVALLHDLPAAG